MKDFSLLAQLNDAHGPSGREDEVRKIVCDTLSSVADEITFDGLGSVIARLNRNAHGPKVAVVAHMDEVGFLIREIRPDGLLKVFKLGGIDPVVAANSELEIKTRFGQKYTGLMWSNQPLSGLTIDDLWLDVGANSQEEVAEMGIEIGDSAVFATRHFDLNNSGNLVAKAMDDRIGCWLGLELMKSMAGQPLPCDLYFVATVQEEVGTKGGKTAIEQLRPDIVLVLDVATAKHATSGSGTQRLYGHGPCLVVADKIALGHYPLLNLVSDVAKEHGIQVQRDFLAGGGTDNGPATLVGGGIAGLAIILPVRNCHSPYTQVNQNDAFGCLTLLQQVVTQLDEMQKAHLYPYY
ncbi:M42 family peptidase [Vibrio sinensis]|uniref:M42 family peptidase n=1 Tax=Vibrio sinensis TaxID=2302434 RepID=A0A3A6QP09_9VIBR|nr:M42 family peptidase [Vibrio sinensis]RJX70037.1 M42 family peptidase [Vibrio sinensis]